MPHLPTGPHPEFSRAFRRSGTELFGFGTAAAFGLGIALTVVLAATGGTQRTFVDELAYLVLVSGTAAWYGMGAGLAASVVTWLMLDGFLVDRHGQLRVHGVTDVWRAGALVAGAAAGALVRWVVRRREETPGGGPQGRDLGDGGGDSRDRYERAA